MKSTIKTFATLFVAATFAFAGCEKEDNVTPITPDTPEEETPENIYVGTSWAAHLENDFTMQQQGMNIDMEITYDDASQTLTLKNAIIYAATGYGIQSKLSSPKIKLIGDNTITADNGMGVRIQPGTEEPDKAIISGGGSLNIKASGVGLRSHLNLFLTDGVKITSEGDAIGFQGWKAVSSDDPLPTLTMTGPETMLRTKGTREGSFASYGQLNLQDDIRIMQPSGATFVPNIGIVNNNQLVTDEWVLIAKPARGDVNLDGTVDIADVTAVLTAMANGSHDPQYRVNDDEVVDIADVTAILTIMAGQ